MILRFCIILRLVSCFYDGASQAVPHLLRVWRKLLKKYPQKPQKEFMFDQHFDCRDVAFLESPQEPQIRMYWIARQTSPYLSKSKLFSSGEKSVTALIPRKPVLINFCFALAILRDNLPFLSHSSSQFHTRHTDEGNLGKLCTGSDFGIFLTLYSFLEFHVYNEQTVWIKGTLCSVVDGFL